MEKGKAMEKSTRWSWKISCFLSVALILVNCSGGSEQPRELCERYCEKSDSCDALDGSLSYCLGQCDDIGLISICYRAVSVGIGPSHTITECKVDVATPFSCQTTCERHSELDCYADCGPFSDECWSAMVSAYECNLDLDCKAFDRYKPENCTQEQVALSSMCNLPYWGDE